MSEPGTPSFDSLRIFLAVAEAGSLAGAGRRLGRAVSVVSYGVDSLEAQLGLALFERDASKRLQLTSDGRAIMAEARAVTIGMDALRAMARGLINGLEAELVLAVDVLLPPARLGSLLRDLAANYPTVRLRLHVEALGGVADLVLSGRADLGVSGPLATDHSELAALHAGEVTMVPVAAPGHTLASGRISPGAARDHVQLVLSDRSPLTQGRDFAVMSDRTWRLADLGAKHQLLREGIGWGNMPLPLVEEDLESGRLRLLDVPDHPGGSYGFYIIRRHDRRPGPAGAWLIERILATAGHRDNDEVGVG
ncbi:LysR family transcriptional regulator [Sphingomonas sp. DT-51]|uniref:LysR family transcriptional regulator n=1 Tax=Sphingomonas sp. DT-51 TaxID=3396165 RepID=UPI003F1AF988